MAMFLVVPGEELAAERQAVVVGRKPLRELWPVLERLELAFRERIVVGHVRRLCDLTTPNAASNWATVCEVIDVPRSAWIVSWPSRCSL